MMELLKEEYERSERAKARKEARERAHPAVTSTNSLSSIQVGHLGASWHPITASILNNHTTLESYVRKEPLLRIF